MPLASIFIPYEARGKGEMKVTTALTAILLSIAINLCLLASYRMINIESSITLVIFDLLFVSLIFQLKGSLIKKMLILAVGNAVGFSCNFLFFNFSYAGLNYFHEFQNQFNAFYTVIFPFLNMIWIVPFWSFSLSFLIESKEPS
jgi:hypothetical protein